MAAFNVKSEKFDDTVKPEGRSGDIPARKIALVGPAQLTRR